MNASCRPTPTVPGWRLPEMHLEGTLQMALDAWLLDQCVTGRMTGPILRFYTWPGAWLSLGHHQRVSDDHWLTLQQQGQLKRVRRPSGGGAVLHATGLTYALVWPDAPRGRREAYGRTTEWLMGAFEHLGLPLHPGQETAMGGQTNCFGSATRADLVDASGHKRIGSAQFWRRGHLLQHGEILLTPPAELWRSVFGSSPSPPWAAPARSRIIQALEESIQTLWPHCRWAIRDLSTEEWQELEHRRSLYRL